MCGTTGMLETTWRQHGDNGWGPQGCGDHMGTIMETTWGQDEDLMWIIQFCLKICDLLRHPNLWVDVWVVGWISGLYGWVNG